MNGINFDPQGPLRTPPAYMNQGGGGGNAGSGGGWGQGFSDPVTLALLGAGAGLLDPNGGTMAGFQGAMQGMNAGNQMKHQGLQHQLFARKLQKQIEIEDYMKSLSQKHGNNLQGMLQGGMLSGIPEVMGTMSKISSGLKGQYLKSQGADGKGTYQYANNIGQVSDTGIPLAPEKLMQINRGSHIDLANPYTGEAQKSLAVGMNPGDSARLAQSDRHFGATHGLAQENSALNRYKTMMETDPEFLAQKAGVIAGGRENGKIRAETAANLPQNLGILAETLNLSDDLKNHPGLDNMVGNLPKRMVGKAFAVFGGNKEADFSAKMEQAQGKQFLSAIQYMKGFGQLTEREGDKMQSSAASMNVAQSPDDFKKAQDDYQAALFSGVRKVSSKLGMNENDVMNMLNKERAALRGGSKRRGSSDGWGELR